MLTLRQKQGVDIDTVLHWQDAQTLHCSNASLEYRNCYFPGDRQISCCTDHPWSAHSQDLSPLDYFLWNTHKTGSMVRLPKL